MRAPLLALLLTAPLALLAGCGGGTSAPSGTLLISRIDGIYERGIDAPEETLLITADEPDAFLLDPAVSPDGSRIAYIVQPPPRVVDGRYDSGSDLWVANRDGSGRRLVYAHAQPNALTRFPAWTDDGHVAVIVQGIIETEQLTEVVYTVRLADVETGELRLIVEDALSLGAAPSGGELAIVRHSDAGETLQVIALDGTILREAVAAAEELMPIAFPRFSPDGSRIAFAASDAPLVTAPVRGGARNGIDGPPQDIWLVDAAGGTPRRIADLKEDSPGLTWDGSGEHVYVLGGLGLYDVNVTNGAIVRIGEGAFHGQIAWAPGR